MILKEVESQILGNSSNRDFIYPYYNRFCFSNIPATIQKFFNINPRRTPLPSDTFDNRVKNRDASKLILILIDGFSYDQMLRYSQEYKFFHDFIQKGWVMPLTSIFPSTTAASLTSINSGLTPQEHGLPEWLVYFREIDMTLNTLPFTPLRNNGRSLDETKINPKILFKGNTVYQKLNKHGIKSFSFINQAYAFSTYSRLVHKGSIIVPFNTVSDLAVTLRKQIEDEKGFAYFHVYLDGVDSIAHRFGPYTDEYQAELSTLSFILEDEFIKKVDKKARENTIILLTADHGHLNISPHDTIYLNTFPLLVKSLQKSASGNIIQPTGSPRDIFLHIEQNKIDKIYSYLSHKCRKKAQIVKTDDALMMGLFGTGKLHKEFRARIGDLLILPYGNNTIWYKQERGEVFNLMGHHGGLSREEMLIPFGFANLSDLS